MLLGCLGEPGKEVALQIAVVIGKIARFDVPREWPELLPALMAAIQNSGGNDLVQHRYEKEVLRTLRNFTENRRLLRYFSS